MLHFIGLLIILWLVLVWLAWQFSRGHRLELLLALLAFLYLRRKR
jgi:hypothetical protein